MAEINKEDLFSDDALKAPLELAKNLGAVASSIDAITEASKKSEKQIKEANSTSKLTKETEQLTLQEKELIKVQNQISIALAKNNDEYIEHKRGLDAINRAVKEKINKGREDQTLTGKLTKGMKELKEELKQAKNAMLAAADAGGTMSKEYQDAAKQAGEIADKIGDAKDEAKVFANDTAFGALGTRMGLLADKARSLDFKGVGEQLKGLGKIILSNPLLLLAGIVIGIGAALVALKDKIYPVAVAFEYVGKAVDYGIQKLKEFSDWVGISNFAADDKADAVVEAANKEIEAIQKRYDREIAIAESAGKDVVKLEEEKWNAVIDEATKGLKELYGASQRRKLTEEEKKTQADLYDVIANANTQKQILNNKAIAKDKEAKEKAAKEEMELNKRVLEYTQKVIENLTSTKIAAAQKEKALREQILKEIEQFTGVEVDLNSKMGNAILNGRLSIQRKIQQGNEEAAKYNYDNLVKGLEDTLFIYNDFAFSIGDLLASIGAQQLQDIELQKRANKEKLDSDLIAAGNNEAAKEKIKLDAAKVDKRLADEQLKIRRRQAIYDKATALFNAGLNVALAITKAIPNPVLIALSSALGAIQIAAIASKPIPAYAKGTKSAIGGISLVGELGTEIVKTPDGKVSLTPDKPTLMDIPRGSEVIPNKETLRSLALAGLSVGDTTMRDYSTLNEIKLLRKTFKDSSENIVNAVKSSARSYEKQGSILYRLTKSSDGSVRKKIIG